MSEAAIRAARPTEVDELTRFLIDARAHISGCRSPRLFRAMIEDSFGPSPRTTIVVAEIDGELAAGLLAVNHDHATYYRSLVTRRPSAASALLWHRARKLPARVRRRRQRRAVAPPTTSTASHADTPTDLSDEPRLQQPPRRADQPGPHATDSGPHLAFCVMLVVAPRFQGRGLSKQVVAAALGHVRSLGATRYDCSFAPRDPAASRLYLSFPSDIQRFATGYHVAIDLHDLEPEPLPR